MENQYFKYKEKFADKFYVVRNTSLVPDRELHCHDEFEITFIRSGDRNLNVLNNGKLWPLKRNCVVCFHNLDIHMLQRDVPEPCERCSVHFLPESVIPYCTKNTDLLYLFFNRLSNPGASNIIQLSEEQGELFFELFCELDRLRNSASRQEYGADVAATIILVRVLLLLNKVYGDINQKSGDSSHKGDIENYNRFCDIISFIQENFSAPLTLDVLTKRFYISRSQINTLFRNITGLTPTQYISEYRLHRAKILLLKDKPVNAVCFECGYKCQSHFCRVFKQHEGMSPKKYQSTFRNQKFR